MSRALIGVLGVAIGMVMSGAGMAFSAIPDPTGTIHGCVNKLTGQLRVIDPSTGAACIAAVESSLNFNQQGPQGVPGPSGSKGDKGDKGDPGASAVRLFARFSADGTLRSGSGVTSAFRDGAGSGIYELTFDRDVSGCAATATSDGDATTADGAFPANLSIEHGGGTTGIPADQIDISVFNNVIHPGEGFPRTPRSAS